MTVAEERVADLCAAYDVRELASMVLMLRAALGDIAAGDKNPIARAKRALGEPEPGDAR